MVNMNFYFRIVCALIASVMATHALSQDLSGWSDKTVCRLASSQQGAPQYLQEAKNRGLSCGSGVVKQQGSVIANNSYTMFSEDFENGDRRDVQVDDNGNNKWYIKQDEDGNSIFCNEVTHLWADYNLGSKNGANYSISYRMKFAADKEGQLETHIRKTNDGDYRASIYSLSGRANIEFARSADIFYESIASGVASTKVDAWSEIQLIASGNDINYLVDGKIVASATDSRAKNGFAMIAVAPNSAVCIDDIVVSKIKVKSDEITFFDQEYEIPDNIASQPNDATISHYYMKNDTLRLRPEAYKVDASSNPVKFVKQIEQHKVIDREMATKTAFSYLYYEDGLVIYDAMPPDGRFSMELDNSSYFSSHSMGKSITSYIIGHAICEGYIKSIDAPIADWPLMENTLFYGQPLIKLLNMNAGDTNVIKLWAGKFTKTGRNIHGSQAAGGLSSFAKNPLELANTKPVRAPKFSYSNLTADVLFNYMMHRVGPDFDSFIANFYQNKVRIEHPIYLEMNPIEGRPDFASTQDRIKQGVGRYGISATRYDYLRIAKAMMDNWQNDTCEGAYLKSIYDRRVAAKAGERRVGTWPKKDRRWGEADFSRVSNKYGGQFWSDPAGLSGRNVLIMTGANGQTIVMDMDKSRIVVISAGKALHINQKKLAYEPIKYGRIR
jgi:hypothetical protein